MQLRTLAIIGVALGVIVLAGVLVAWRSRVENLINIRRKKELAGHLLTENEVLS